VKEVLEHIGKNSDALAEHALWVYLRDPKVPAHERLRFVPCCTHFIMTFADLCRYFLPQNPPRDRYDELVNMNLAEEADHWKWFLADLTNLDVDPQLRFTDAVRAIWSDASVQARLLGYELCKLSADMSSLEKLVMVLCIEATGKVALEASTPAGLEVAASRGLKLVYFGMHHLESENAHTLREDEFDRAVRSLVLDADQRRSFIGLVDQIFTHFGRFVDEAFAFIKRASPPM
jgi:hypothetical protein